MSGGLANTRHGRYDDPRAALAGELPVAPGGAHAPATASAGRRVGQVTPSVAPSRYINPRTTDEKALIGGCCRFG